MLRVYFPAGNQINETVSHTDFKKAYFREAHEEADRGSVTLLSRIFSLIEVDLGDNASIIFRDELLDYDLAMFNTYAANFKRQMRFVFQTIMYRAFREDRCDIETCRF